VQALYSVYLQLYLLYLCASSRGTTEEEATCAGARVLARFDARSVVYAA
jgi:hypothetical protein